MDSEIEREKKAKREPIPALEVPEEGVDDDEVEKVLMHRYAPEGAAATLCKMPPLKACGA